MFAVALTTVAGTILQLVNNLKTQSPTCEHKSTSMSDLAPFHLSLFGTFVFTAASFILLSHPSSGGAIPAPGERYQTGEEEARVAALQEEEEKLNAEEEGLTVPEDSPRPVLIIVMVGYAADVL